MQQHCIIDYLFLETVMKYATTNFFPPELSSATYMRGRPGWKISLGLVISHEAFD